MLYSLTTCSSGYRVSTTPWQCWSNTVYFTYLEDLREETWADLLAEEVIDAGQAGHGAPQGPVRGRAHPVGGMDAVERRLVRTAVNVLAIAEAALGVVVHGAGWASGLQVAPLCPAGGTTVCVRPQVSWGMRGRWPLPSLCRCDQMVSCDLCGWTGNISVSHNNATQIASACQVLLWWRRQVIWSVFLL